MQSPWHALQVTKVKFKSVSNETYLSHEAEANSRPYLPSHFSGVTETPQVELPVHYVQAVQFRLKSVSNEG
jgi:hypothetical protein